jgi:hypothetical protein
MEEADIRPVETIEVDVTINTLSILLLNLYRKVTLDEGKIRMEISFKHEGKQCVKNCALGPECVGGEGWSIVSMRESAWRFTKSVAAAGRKTHGKVVCSLGRIMRNVHKAPSKADEML